MKYFLILILILTLKVQPALGQGFRSRFYLPGSFNNTARAIFETSPGNYFAAGFVADTLNGYNTDRLTIMGLNSIGQPLWAKKYGNAKFQYLMNTFIRRSFYKQGNFIYHACCVRDSNNKQFGVLLKFNQNGDTVWQKIYRDAIEDVIPQMVTSSIDGGFLITGFFQNWVNHTQPALLIKTDANGNELWRKRLHKMNPDVSDGKAILQDSVSKKIIIAGYNYQSGAINYENILLLDSLGNNPVSTAFLSNGGTIYDMIQSRKDTSIIIVGLQYESQTIGGYNLMRSYVVKFNISNPNTPVWKIVLDKPTLANAATCIRENNSGELVVAGVIDTMQINNMATNALVRISKITSSGYLTNQRYYDYKINDSLADNNLRLSFVDLTSDLGYIAALEVINFPNPNNFFYVKYGADGCDTLAAHCATMNLVGISETRNKIDNITIYPNPVNDFLKVELLDTISIDQIEVTIYDILGKEVKKADLKSTLSIELMGLEKGIYFIKVMRNGNFICHQKIIKE